MSGLSPPVDGLKGHWSMSRRGPEPRRFFGDPTSLACDNIFSPNDCMLDAHADTFVFDKP